MKKLFVFALPFALASCTMMMGGGTYNVGKQPAAGDLNPTGTVMVKPSGDMVMTQAQVMGLKPNQLYVAHYHIMGTASTNPCDSGGPAIISSKIVSTSDATGKLVLNGSVRKTDVMNATYFNVHTASDAEGTPADAGVACTAVKMNMGM